MSKRKSKLSRFIIALVVLLVLALAIGAIFKFTSAGDEITDLFDTTFRVEFDGKNYTNSTNEIYLPTNEQARFDVKSVKGYSVVIKPNVTEQTDFTYTVDGISYKFSETNLTKAFLSSENVKGGYFKLNAIKDYSLESILSKLYENQTVVVYSDIVNPYIMAVTSGDKTINFVICIAVSGITLNYDHINF